MKKLIYIFIPILAILLMSHNSYAATVVSTGSTGYSSGTIYFTDIYGVQQTIGGVVNTSEGMSFASPTAIGATWAVNLNFRNVPSNKFVISIPYRVCFSSPDDMKSWVGFSSNDYYYLMSNTWEYTSAGCFSGVVQYYANGGYNNISLGNNGAIIGSVSYSYNIVFGKASYVVLSDDANYNSALNEIKNKIPSASDIADAVNEPEENAASDIENQSTSDIDTGDDSSATNLIGNINTLFTQIGNIEASDTCSVPADFGNLDLGNINFCTGKDKLPFVVTFGAYAFELIFVVGTAIILVKQVLGLFDWARS